MTHTGAMKDLSVVGQSLLNFRAVLGLGLGPSPKTRCSARDFTNPRWPEARSSKLEGNSVYKLGLERLAYSTEWPKRTEMH